MKKYLLLLASVLLLAACSSPKYAYYFDHYDYNSGKKKVETPASQLPQTTITTPDVNPLLLDENNVTASAENKIQPVEYTSAQPVEYTPAMVKEKASLLEQKYKSLSKAEKKEFRKELKTEVKKMIKAKKNGDSLDLIKERTAMDHDLKMALIFGIVGILLSAFGGVNSIFWILGVISTVIAIVFLIKWLAEQ
jgi:hypothetical protein